MWDKIDCVTYSHTTDSTLAAAVIAAALEKVKQHVLTVLQADGFTPERHSQCANISSSKPRHT